MHKRGKCGGKKGKTSTAYFNCHKEEHSLMITLSRNSNLSSRFIFVTRHVMVAHHSSDWIVVSGAIEHAARDRVGFVEYR